MSDELQALYESLQTEVHIKARFITPKIGETNHLEFKGKADRRHPGLAENDKKNFSKALSAFSNADGGLLVWGVSTRRRDGRDYAAGVKSIQNVEDFAERLRTSLLDTIIPQNPGIRIGVIKNRQGNGYVKCLIPASEHRPHRAMLAEREYWIRMDGRTLRLEHYQIRDMMTRHANPDLHVGMTGDDSSLPPGQAKIHFRLYNTGKAVAKYAGWFARFENATIVMTDGCNDLTQLNEGRATVSHDVPVGAVIHPNGISTHAGTVIVQAIEGTEIRLSLRCYCEGMTTRGANHVIEVDDPPTAVVDDQVLSVEE
jgi:Schlafen, AlbA_2